MRRTGPEDSLQMAVVSTLECAGLWPVHVPNQGKRSWGYGAELKRMGLWTGFPDLLVFGPGCGLIAAIELKAPPKMLKSGKLSKAKPDVRKSQEDALARLNECGVPTLVCRSIPEVLDGLRALGAPLKARVAA